MAVQFFAIPYFLWYKLLKKFIQFLLVLLISINCVSLEYNKLFPSSVVPLFQNETKYETFHMKMSSACMRSFIFMQIEVIFITIVSHLYSL